MSWVNPHVKSVLYFDPSQKLKRWLFACTCERQNILEAAIFPRKCGRSVILERPYILGNFVARDNFLNLVMYRLCSWEMNYGYPPEI